MWKNGWRLPELIAVADRAADDPAQHVAASLVAGNDAVDDQERAGADVIGDHAQRRIEIVGGTRLAHRGADQVLEEVDLVVGMHVLQHRGEALEPHPGVDARASAADASPASSRLNCMNTRFQISM